MQDLTSVTGYELRADDKTGPGVRSAREGLMSLHGAAEGLRGKLGALGGVLSVGLFANAIKNAIDYADRLNDLSQQLGMTVEFLGGIGYAAAQSGTDLESVAKASQKLAQNMAAAAGGNKAAMATFEAMGLSVRNADGSLKSLDAMLLTVADKFASYEDGAGKAALANELMGKMGAAAIPFLNQGGEAIAKLIDEFNRYGGVTTDTAQRADAFNDTVNKLQLIFGALFKQIAAALLPALQALADWFVTLKGNGESFRVVSDGIVVAFRGLAVGAMVVVEAFRAVGKSIGTVLGAIVAYLRGDSMATIWAGLKDGFADVASSIGGTARAVVDVWNAELPKLNTTATAAATGLAKIKPPIIAAAEAMEKLRTSLGALKLENDAMNESWREGQKFLEKHADWLKKNTEETNRARADMVGFVRGMEEEAAALTMTGRERAARLFDLQAERHELTLTADELARYRERYLAAFDRAETIRAQTSFYDDMRSLAADFFEDFGRNGTKAFANLWERFKSWGLQALAAIAARRVVVSIFGEAAGGAGGMANAATSLLGAGSNMLGPLASLFGGGAPSGGMLLGATSGFGGGITASLDSFLINAGLEGMAGGALTGALGMIGAAAPWIAGALMIAQALGAFDRGGPKTEGSASSLADLVNGSIGPGGMGRLFTADGQDAAYQKITDATATSYLQTARLLGLTTGTAGFSIGGAIDPEGDAGSLISAQAMVNGRNVYSVADLDVGRDEGAFNERLALEAKRAMFAALQASDLPAYLADLFAGIDAAGATAEQIDGILATATALRIVVDAMQGLGAQFAAMDPADVQAFVESFGGLEGMLQRIAFVGENFYTDAQKLEQATARLSAGFADLGVAVPTTHAAFLELLNGLDLTTEEGRAMYEALSALAPLFVQVHGTAQQAADALADQVDATEDLADAVKALTVDMGALSNLARSEFERIMASIGALVGEMSGTLGDKLTQRIRLTNVEIARLTQGLASIPAGTGDYQAALDVIARLQAANAGAAAELARFTILAAQYDAARAEQLVGLESWYAEQQRLYSGNAEALDALRSIFAQRWQAIIDGVGSGVGGTIDELERLRESLRDYLDGLALRSDLSPLSPAARLAEAQRQYGDVLGRAQGGDVDALRQLQSAADAYLKVARELYASAPEFSAIWQSVVDSLSTIAEPPSGGSEPQAAAAIAAALPDGSPLASQADIAALRETVDVLMARLIDETRSAAAGAPVVRQLQRQTATLTEGARPLK